MVTTNCSKSSSVVMAASKSCVHFTIALDMELLAYVRSLNSFTYPVQCTVITVKIQELRGMPFNARKVRNFMS